MFISPSNMILMWGSIVLIVCVNFRNNIRGNLQRYQDANSVQFEDGSCIIAHSSDYEWNAIYLSDLRFVLGRLYIWILVFFSSNLVNMKSISNHHSFTYLHTYFTYLRISFTIRIWRSSFPQKSFVACAFIVSFQTCNVLYGTQTLYTVASLFIELVMYLTTLMRDIKTAFVQMDQLAQNKNIDEAAFLLYIKDVLILHESINKYKFCSLNWKSFIRFSYHFWFNFRNSRLLSIFADATHFIVLLMVVPIGIMASTAVVMFEKVKYNNSFLLCQINWNIIILSAFGSHAGLQLANAITLNLSGFYDSVQSISHSSKHTLESRGLGRCDLPIELASISSQCSWYCERNSHLTLAPMAWSGWSMRILLL